MNAELLDQTDMGRNATWQMRYHVERPPRACDRIGDERFFHIYNHEMMRDTMDVMRRIYEWADEPLAAETDARIRNWLAEHPQDLFALNTYSLDQYGLRVEQLEPIFAECLDTFDIELEGTP